MHINFKQVTKGKTRLQTNESYVDPGTDTSNESNDNDHLQTPQSGPQSPKHYLLHCPLLFEHLLLCLPFFQSSAHWLSVKLLTRSKILDPTFYLHRQVNQDLHLMKWKMWQTCLQSSQYSCIYRAMVCYLPALSWSIDFNTPQCENGIVSSF